MTRLVAFSFLALVSACADGVPSGARVEPNSAPAEVVRTVDVATLKTDLDRGAVPLLVDVRTPGEFAAGHVTGAKNVPVGELDGRLAEFGTLDAEVYVICQSGGRSARASATLAAKGVHPVNVAGGTGAWVAAGYPVAR